MIGDPTHDLRPKSFGSTFKRINETTDNTEKGGNTNEVVIDNEENETNKELQIQEAFQLTDIMKNQLQETNEDMLLLKNRLMK